MRYFNQYALYADLRTLVVNVNMQYYGYLGTINRRLSTGAKCPKSWKYERDPVYRFLTRDIHVCQWPPEVKNYFRTKTCLFVIALNGSSGILMYISRVILSFFL